MAWQTLGGFNSSEGAYRLLTYASSTVAIFTPMLLLSIFLVTLFGSYYAQQRVSNRSNFKTSFALAGFFTAIISYVMMLMPGLINGSTVAITTVIAVVSFLTLALSNN